MSISPFGYQSPSLTAVTAKSNGQPAWNVAQVTYTEMTPEVIKERKLYSGAMYTSGAFIVSAYLSQPIHKGLQKYFPKMAQNITQKGLERGLALSGLGLFLGTAIAVLGFCKHPNKNITLENVDLSALKQSGTVTKQS